MNTPNKITIFRMILSPLFLLFLLWNFKGHFIVSLLIFIIASLTDLIDGKIARKYNLITDFGKFLDPIADKMITTAAFLGFMVLNIGYGVVWITFIILLREFIVSSLRMVAAGKGNVIAADIFGKAKTVCQMITIIVVIFIEILKVIFTEYLPNISSGVYTAFVVIDNTLLWLSAVLTIISGVNYIVKNFKSLDMTK